MIDIKVLEAARKELETEPIKDVLAFASSLHAHFPLLQEINDSDVEIPQALLDWFGSLGEGAEYLMDH